MASRIRNGLVIDGTGGEPYRADVAIAAGRIAEIGKIGDAAHRVIDASDQIVRAGIYRSAHPLRCPDLLGSGDLAVPVARRHDGDDGQLRRRHRTLPARGARGRNARSGQRRVDPVRRARPGHHLDWGTFPQYLDAAARRRSALNLAFLAPLTPFRPYVMGEESMERAATPKETARIKALLKAAVTAGAFGFSTTGLTQHIGHQG